MTGALMRARTVSGAGQPTRHYCSTVLGQGGAAKLTTIKLFILAKLVFIARRMSIWCASLKSSQSVKMFVFPPQRLGSLTSY